MANQPRLRLATGTDPVRGYQEVPEVGGFLSAQTGPQAQEGRDRRGLSVLQQFQSSSGAMAVYTGQQFSRLLKPEQLWKIYLSTPDVRACIDSIVRRVATWDWTIEIHEDLDPQDERYELAQAAAAKVKRFLEAPVDDALMSTFQEFFTAVGIDLLVFDAGVFELVENVGGALAELNPLRGADIFPVIDKHNKVEEWRQLIFSSFGQSGVVMATKDDDENAPRFEPEDIVYLRLFSNTTIPLGLPLIDTIVNEAVSLLVSSEHALMELDAQEIPPGLLVLGGIGEVAAKRARAELKYLKGKDHRIRMVHSSHETGVSAKWVEFRRTMKDVALVEVTETIRRMIWRVFGVMPVEMGSTEGMPRATAHVQVDVSSSHLITPILELVQAKFNARVVPRILQTGLLEELDGEDLTEEEVAELCGLIRFAFDFDTRKTSEERKDDAEAHETYVEIGVLTRNEVRKELGKGPIPGGDVATVLQGGVYVPVSSFQRFLDGGPSLPDDEEPGPGEGPSEPGPDGEPGPGEEVEEEQAKLVQVIATAVAQALGAALRSPPCRQPGESVEDCVDRKVPELIDEGMDPDQAVAVAHELCSEACESHREEGELEPGLPSEWQPGGKFEGYRTLDLTELGRIVAGYSEAVLPVYRESGEAVAAAFTSELLPDGGVEDEQRLRNRINQELDRLSSRWVSAGDPFYERAGKVGRDAAVEFTGAQVAEDWQSEADAYRERAVGWLTDMNGPIEELRRRLGLIINDITGRAGRAKELTPSSVPGDVMEAVDTAWESQAHRVDNWSGRLVELANATMVAGLVESEALPVAPGEPKVEWWAEWVAVGDRRTCVDCDFWGSQGFMPLSQFGTTPGGDTQCRARCRCVLTLWLKSEVDAGIAVPLSGATGP